MSPKTGIELRWTSNGDWRPPKASGHNVADPPIHFYFNGEVTEEMNGLPHVQMHRTYSIYHDRGTFWIVDYDASREPVGDGIDNNPQEDTPRAARARRALPRGSNRAANSSDESDNDNSDRNAEKADWDPLKFKHRDHDKRSYAGRRLPHSRLCTRRLDQAWAEKLLSDTCSAPEITDDEDHGGLVGELPLLLALVAFAVPETRMADGLCQAIGRTWNAPNWPRAVGCELLDTECIV